MYKTILSQIRTTEDRQRLKEEIEILLSTIYEVGEDNFKRTLENSVREKIATLLSEEIFADGVDKEKYLRGLQDALDNIKTVKLALAFEPARVSVDKFWQFFVSTLGENIILEIEYLPRIIGGVILVYDGKYRDYSLKQLLRSDMIESSGEVLGELPKEQKVEAGKDEVNRRSNL